MKQESRWLVTLATAVGFLLLTGCNTVSITSHQYLGGQTFAATNPAQVEILRTAPTRPHVRLGEVQAEPSGNSVDNAKIEQALQKAAAKMGANAVVIVVDRTQVVAETVTGPLWARSIDPVSGRVIIGIAIRYL
jgi:hypothetical protein